MGVGFSPIDLEFEMDKENEGNIAREGQRFVNVARSGILAMVRVLASLVVWLRLLGTEPYPNHRLSLALNFPTATFANQGLLLSLEINRT